MKLGAISVRGNDRYALINSRVMRSGDEIGGMTIERIERDRVILSAGGRNYTLTWEK
jgi:type II secretory pathway component PulC